VAEQVEHLLADVLQLEAEQARLSKAEINYMDLAQRLLELPERLTIGWFRASEDEKKELLNLTTSNSKVRDGKALIELIKPLDLLTDLEACSDWRTTRNVARTILAQHRVTIETLHKRLCA
jgi:hypothetical protein